MSQLPSRELVDGEFEMIPADTRLQGRALRNGSPTEIARLLSDAENALGALRGEFDRWLESESERLGALLDNFRDEPTRVWLDQLYRALHDLRGNASTFGNPLAARIADAACKLIDAAGMVPEVIIAAHVQAIRAVIREKADESSHPVGGLILSELAKLARSVPVQSSEDGEGAIT
jgi:hypothetical protein